MRINLAVIAGGLWVSRGLGWPDLFASTRHLNAALAVSIHATECLGRFWLALILCRSTS